MSEMDIATFSSPNPPAYRPDPTFPTQLNHPNLLYQHMNPLSHLTDKQIVLNPCVHGTIRDILVFDNFLPKITAHF